MKKIYIKGITLSTSPKINTLLFADDQVITEDLENNLQRRAFHVTKHSKKNLE
jgi:ActR/RegA family two-component response regulator